jgi:membrane-associated phospholipid phosphatase
MGPKASLSGMTEEAVGTRRTEVFRLSSAGGALAAFIWRSSGLAYRPSDGRDRSWGTEKGMSGVQDGYGTVVWAGVDERWFEAINNFAQQTPWLHDPARLYADYGVVLFAGLLLWAWWRARASGDASRMAAALWAPMGTLIAVGVNQFIGAAVAEPRPYAVLPGALVLVSRSTDYSFPSDHAVMAGAVAVGVLLVDRRLGGLAVAMAVLMASTRVYVGAHFPADVAAGVLVGVVVCLLSYLPVRSLLRWLVLNLERTRIRVLLTGAEVSL